MKVDFDQIKGTTDIVRVVESYGIPLKKVGHDHVGLCPFHDDHKPSLRVTQGKGLFRCPACEATGNVIQFVARKEGITEHAAAVKLLGQTPGVTLASKLRGGASTQTPVGPAELNRQQSSGEAAALLQRVVCFYAKTLHKDRAGRDYLKHRKLDESTMLEVFQLGYSNGTMPGTVPTELVEPLQRLGVLNAKGREHFEGCVTVPIFECSPQGPTGSVVGIYGRRIVDGEVKHLYLPGPHRGVFNGAAAKTSTTLLVCEAIFDALSLWQAGFKNVISLYGAKGWTTAHTALLREHQTREVYLCLDNDEAGREGTQRLQETVLPDLVKAIHALQWPAGVKDANDFFLTHGAADFEALLKAANPSLAQREHLPAEERLEPAPGGFIAHYAARQYIVLAIEQPGPSRLRATIRAVGGQGRFVIDTVDLYLSRSRRGFMSESARLFGEKVETIEADLNRLTERIEAFVKEAAVKPAVAVVSDAEKIEGLKLGRHPDLVGEILRDVERLGLVGEQVNKLIGYLVLTSRKMADPLALLILSGSGAGKSLLQDTLLKLCPDEDLIQLTSLSDRALFYKGQDSLKNKVLAVEEVAGAEGAHYAIRNLISAKKLVIETTVKNPLTGQLTTQLNTVHGPTAVFQTTTRPDLDAETRSRFIVTSIDESPEQTRAILEAQRHSHTLEGLRRRQQRETILARHRAFQRLLKPLVVVNPFEPLLSYTEDRLAVRRDNPKYLNLILAVTFLYQMRRPVKHDELCGDYLETTLEDIAIANELATALFGQSLDELSRPGRELLRLIFDYAQGQASKQKTEPDKIHFTRRELREALKWSQYQLRTYLDELTELEYVLPLSGRQGQPFRYRLLYDGQAESGGKFLAGLKSVEQLRQEAEGLGFVVREPTSRGKTALRGDFNNFAGTSFNGSHEVAVPKDIGTNGVLTKETATSRESAGGHRGNFAKQNGRSTPSVVVSKGGAP